MIRSTLILAGVLSAALGLVAQTLAGPPPPGTALIVGRVVDAGGGSPPTGVIVAIAGAGIPGRRVLVDPQGRFLFGDLPAGAYTITATKTGFLDAAYGRLRPDGAGRPLVLRDGDRVTDATVRMWRFASISGTVTDDADDPVGGARVQVWKRTVIAGRWRFVNSNIGADVDGRGNYRVVGLVPGEYAVAITSFISAFPASLMGVAVGARQSENGGDVSRIASTNGTFGLFNDIVQGFGATRVGDMMMQSGATQTVIASPSSIRVYPTVWYPAAPAIGQATVLRLDAGDTRTGIDLHETLMPAFRVSGHVTGPDGPVPFLALRLVPATIDDVAAEITSSPALSLTSSWTASDANGDFTFMAVVPGSYLIRAITTPPRPPADPAPQATILRSADGMSSSVASGPALPPMVTREPTLWTATPVTVGDSDLSSVAVVMRPGLRVFGQVEFEGTAARPTGNELRAIKVSLDPADGRSVWYASSYQGQIDPTGAFYTIGVMAGSYVLHADGLPRGWSLKSATVGGTDISDRPIALESKDVSGLVVTLTDQPAGLAGTVRDAQGRANEDAVVLVFPADGVWTNLGATSRRLRSARPGRDGSFAMSGLPPGDYNVIAISDEFSVNWQAPDALQRLARSAAHVTVIDRQNAKIDLTLTAIR